MENQSPQVIRRLTKGLYLLIYYWTQSNECAVYIEIADLVKNPLEGVIVIPNDANLWDIQAWIQGPGMFLM